MLKRHLLAWAVLVVAVGCLLTAIVLTAPKLPDRVASHFNSAGAADGWMSRSAYLWTMAGTALGVTALLLGVFSTLRYLPPSLINLPNRDYWLAPERRAETYASFLSFGVWMAAFQMLLVLGTHLLVVKANQLQPPVLSTNVWWLLGGFLLSTLALVVSLLRHFRQPAAPMGIASSAA